MTRQQIFVRLSIARMIAGVGSGMTAFALAVYVFQLTDRVASVGWVTFAAFCPMVVFSPVVGALADRYDRRKLMLVGDGGSILALAALMGLYWSNQMSLWPLLILVSIQAVFGSLVEPSYKALISDLLPPSDYAKAAGWIQLGGAAKFLLAPVLAGLMYQHLGVGVILLLDAMTFCITVLAIQPLLRVPLHIASSSTKESIRQRMQDALRSMVGQPLLKRMILLMILITMAVGVFQTLFPPFVLRLSSEQTLGVLQSTAAIGLLLSSLWMASGRTRSLQRSMAIGLSLMGLSLMLMGLFHIMWMIAIFAFLLHVSVPLINVSAEVMVRTSTPNEQQGRVWGWIGCLTQTGYLVAYLGAGVLADRIGPLTTEEATASMYSRIMFHEINETIGIGVVFVMASILLLLGAMLFRRVMAQTII